MNDQLAVISDIHGNADALRAVLEDIQAQGITRIVNLGDHLSGPLAAAETADLLMSAGITCIRGNHDRVLVEQNPKDMAPSDSAAHAQLSRTHLDWLRGLPSALKLSADVMLCHGTPQSDTQYWLEEVLANGRSALRGHEAIAAHVEGTASLFLCGHTHLPRRVDLGKRTILNPGSVGCPAYDDDDPAPHVMENGTPAACYAVVRATALGWASRHHHVPYDASRMIGMAQALGRQDWVRALGTGRA